MTVTQLCVAVLFALTLCAQPLYAGTPSSRHAHKPAVSKSANKIVLGSMVRFSQSTGWLKVSVRTPTGKLIPILEAEPGCAYQSGEWSPDGRYFVAVSVINIRYPTIKQDMAYIIDVKNAKTVTLDSSISADFDHTDFSWVEGKPHSIQLVDGDTKELAEPGD